MDDQEMTITITVKKTETGVTSTHQIRGISELAAGIILIDVGRNILAHLASHHHSHEPAPEPGGLVTTEKESLNGN